MKSIPEKMKEKQSQWFFIGGVVIIVLLLVWFFFFLSPQNSPSSSNQPNPTATSTGPKLTQAGQYPAGFPQQLVIYPNLTPISGGTLVDSSGKTHLVVEFLPGISIAQVYNDYKSKLPGLGWTVTNSGTNGTGTAINLYLEATQGTETLGVSVNNTNLGSKLRLEVVE